MSGSPTEKRRTKQKGWRIDAGLADEFTRFCETRGWNPNRQVEAALRGWLDGFSIARNQQASAEHGPISDIPDGARWTTVREDGKEKKSRLTRRNR